MPKAPVCEVTAPVLNALYQCLEPQNAVYNCEDASLACSLVKAQAAALVF
jgi:hypothetical protein